MISLVCLAVLQKYKHQTTRKAYLKSVVFSKLTHMILGSELASVFVDFGLFEISIVSTYQDSNLYLEHVQQLYYHWLKSTTFLSNDKVLSVLFGPVFCFSLIIKPHFCFNEAVSACTCMLSII